MTRRHTKAESGKAANRCFRKFNLTFGEDCAQMSITFRERGRDVWVWRCLELLTVGCQRKCQTGSRAEALLFWCKTGLGWAGLGWPGLGWVTLWLDILECPLFTLPTVLTGYILLTHHVPYCTALHWTLVLCSVHPINQLHHIMWEMLLKWSKLELYNSSFNQWMVDGVMVILVIHQNRKSGLETTPVTCCRQQRCCSTAVLLSCSWQSVVVSVSVCGDCI